jgi:hypothetical protein
MHRFSLALAVGLLATLLVAGTAAAAGQVQVTRTSDINFDGLAFGVTAACGFTVEVHTVGKTVDIERFDADGNLVSYIGQGVWDGYLLNPANGKSVPSRIAGPIHVQYLDDGTIVEMGTGAIYLRTVPGEGLVSAFVGRIRAVLGPTGEVDEDGFPIFDVVEESFSGQWSGNGGVCEYLAD